ncbi:3-hydroxyacyl-ACP dehydratase FabZ family protein [Lactobacillaceae bacterium Melli_B3]
MSFEVDKYIPQRYPFQMIDQIDEVRPGEGSKATKFLTINEWFFQGQSNPVMPRPIVLECLAQTGVVSLLSMPEYKGRNVFFGGIKSAEYQDDFRPGDKLSLSVEMTKLKHQIGVGHGTVTRDGEVICTADLVFAIE